eukprot:CAMPEP_0185541620 /NCGR_PEP_ID=MMETSP1381-20130426/2090_1 /TAXON_ID=298111 /ORGANISM="Pavlova sp., Strain CCMP459" /LENGTH=98 /DNA_ID=CAMNT_0028153537 /DNA_START=76 /DNA_END=371 /DNA_ORIENTATION=-
MPSIVHVITVTKGATFVAHDDMLSKEDVIGNHGPSRDLHMCICSNISVEREIVILERPEDGPGKLDTQWLRCSSCMSSSATMGGRREPARLGHAPEKD